jgi:hypothetical protein
MKKFGPLKYAVLCKAKETAEGEVAHKGTGFVQFKDEATAQ